MSSSKTEVSSTPQTAGRPRPLAQSGLSLLQLLGLLALVGIVAAVILKQWA